MTDDLANHWCLRGVLVVIAIHVLACRARPEPSFLAQRFAAFTRVERVARSLPDHERNAVLSTGYDQIVAAVPTSKQLDRVDDQDLQILYRSAQLAAFYTHDPAHVRDMALFLDGLQDRGLTSNAEFVQMYEAFVGARMLAEARGLAGRHPTPEMEVLPALHDALDVAPDRPTEWVVSPDRRELLHRNADLDQQVQVVVVSHPLCHFSQAAMRDIEADPLLRKAFEAHATWLAPQDGRINFDVFQTWNRQHPGHEIALAFRREEWPMIDSWGTPTFYVLKGGAVAAKVEGWPKGGRRAELIAALQQTGLVP